MVVLPIAKNALDAFIKDYCTCATCDFWKEELIGGECEGPELSCGYMKDNTGICEQHEFKNKVLQMRLEELQNEWYNAWYSRYKYFL